MSTRTTKQELQNILQMPVIKAAGDRVETAKRQLTTAELAKKALIEAELKKLGIIGLRVVYHGQPYEVVGFSVVAGEEMWLTGRRVLKSGDKSPELKNLFMNWTLPGEIG